MAVDVFGNTVETDIGTQNQRIAEVGRQKGIVDEDDRSLRFGKGSDDFRNQRNWRKNQHWVRGRFDPDNLRNKGQNTIERDVAQYSPWCLA